MVEWKKEGRMPPPARFGREPLALDTTCQGSGEHHDQIDEEGGEERDSGPRATAKEGKNSIGKIIVVLGLIHPSTPPALYI